MFTCQIRDFPDEIFQVTEFDLQEGLSELFSLSIVAVSALPDIDFQTILGHMSSLTVKRDGKKIREVQGLLASIENLNTDGGNAASPSDRPQNVGDYTQTRQSHLSTDSTINISMRRKMSHGYVKVINNKF